MFHLGSVINFENTLMVRAIGGLLSFLLSNSDSVMVLTDLSLGVFDNCAAVEYGG